MQELKEKQELFERQKKFLFNKDLLIQQRFFGKVPKEISQRKEFKCTKRKRSEKKA